MKKTWDRAAMRFASARYVDRQGMLDVTFENGDHFRVAAETILPLVSRGKPLAAPDWTGMRIGETGDVLEVPAPETVIEIPWDRIRSIADPDFRAHLADRADERARRIGERVRALRREAGLSRAELAEKVGVSREAIAGLEAGKIDTPTDLIEEIAAALGRRLKDFAAE